MLLFYLVFFMFPLTLARWVVPQDVVEYNYIHTELHSKQFKWLTTWIFMEVNVLGRPHLFMTLRTTYILCLGAATFIISLVNEIKADMEKRKGKAKTA
jgi:hypothetical protein